MKVDEEKIVSQYINGRSLQDVSVEHDIGKESVRRILLRRGICRRPEGIRPKKRLKLPVVEIAEKYDNGMTTFDLARMYGCSQSIIYQRLREFGVKMRRGGQRQLIEEDETLDKSGTIKIKGENDGNERQEESPEPARGQRQGPVLRSGSLVGLQRGQGFRSDGSFEPHGDRNLSGPGGEQEQAELERTGLQNPVVRREIAKAAEPTRITIKVRGE
jgi:transposase-like protein